MKVAAGMSGGVDSSVAALLMKEDGNEVFGITMRIWAGEPGVAKGHACYGPGEEDEIRRAAEICEIIGIPHHVFDCSEAYNETVLGYFKREYKDGRTPNPCVLCNQRMKFDMLPALANEKLGARTLATGHYARTCTSVEENRTMLLKARDSLKDQTYFLHRLSQEQLCNAVFPLGELSKEQVRKIARENNIPSWDDPESQDFYDGNYREFVSVNDDPGEIVDSNGNVLGRHTGIWNYTIGQRRGLGISAAEPLYVTGIDAHCRKVLVGPRTELLKTEFSATQFNWVSVNRLTGKNKLTVKMRSAHKGASCTAEPVDGSTMRISLDVPEPGITPGQSAVLYDGDIVIGGGIIEGI